MTGVQTCALPIWAYRQSLGHASLDLAGALVETNRLKAIGMLAQAARYGVVERNTLRHLAKALVPGALVRLIQSRRRAVATPG